jgi:hypothetical protein
MHLFSRLLHRIIGRRQNRRVPASKAVRRFRPQLETLEGRDVPSTLTVTNNLDNFSPGSLRYEIDAAAGGDTIVFDSSLNGQTITLAGSELMIAKNLTIQGPGASQLTISGGYYSRIFEVDGATTNANLSGLSLVNGAGAVDDPFLYGDGIGWSGGGNSSSTTDSPVDGHGGAIWNGGILTVNGCNLAYNSADVNYSGSATYLGGAIYNAGTLNINNSTLTYNEAGDYYAGNGGNAGNGGAIYNNGTLNVNYSSLSYNHAYYAGYNTGFGGAIDNAGILNVTGGTISNNSAYAGGGIYSGYRLTANISGVVMQNNSAYDGAAIWNNGAMTLTGCTLSSNTASHAGGGIYNAKQGKLSIISSTVLNNTAPIGAALDSVGTAKISKDSTVGAIA